MSHDRVRWESRYIDARTGDITPSSVLADHLPILTRGRGLDLACGVGRNALALARNGFAVEAIDVAFAALTRLLDSARAERLSINAIQADLEQCPLPPDRYAVVVNVRYLQRSLFPAIRRALMPGGVVVFETFLRAQARAGRPKNPAFLLEPGELRAQFADFHILQSTEGLAESESGPAYLARLVAKRPA